jgi:hypothetical protein
MIESLSMVEAGIVIERSAFVNPAQPDLMNTNAPKRVFSLGHDGFPASS